ncbi:putative secreted protein [Sugiyamaella lignohabitans]|uniref:Putative secreted protein n=1 Tax=Sugiyamaella lignohabitans TaxID=796027 RepID=A0A167EI57_9ASCO|nr:uncharacterized protein AWJ20_5071 [Sugiyamaella lignohabitans]ANB14113.1 putative secreted protein [Sugiyamaella lignohabitans]
MKVDPEEVTEDEKFHALPFHDSREKFGLAVKGKNPHVMDETEVWEFDHPRRPGRQLSPIEKAARRVRHLVHSSNLATVNTIYQDGDRKGLPVGQLEYYADCITEDDPDQPLTFIGLNISTVFRNVNKGSPVSLSIRLGDSSPFGLTPISPAGNPRVSLFGEFIEHKGDKEAAKKCFLHSHHDAHSWIPGDSSAVHDSYWLKFNITGIHFIGGFGDTAYIGDIPVELYRNATQKRRHHFSVDNTDNKQLLTQDWVQLTDYIAPGTSRKLLPSIIKAQGKHGNKPCGRSHKGQDSSHGSLVKVKHCTTQNAFKVCRYRYVLGSPIGHSDSFIDKVKSIISRLISA